MKNIFTLLFLIVALNRCDAQILSFNLIGDMWYDTKTVSPVKFEIEEWDRTYNEFYQFNYIHFFKKKPFSLLLEGKRFLGFTDFTYQIPNKIGSYKGYGSARTVISRVGIGGVYKLLKKSRRFDLGPYLMLNVEQSKITWHGDNRNAVLSRPEFLPYQGTSYIEPIERFQILPQVGINANIRLLWRIFLTANLSYSYGFRPYQKQTFEYSFDGVPQPNASYYSDGTGFFYSFGVGFELYGNNMYQKNKGQFKLRNIL